MAATLCVKFLPKQGWLPLTQSVRYGSKSVTRHRRPVHILKQKLLAVTQFIPPTQTFPPGAFPSRSKQLNEDSPLMKIMKRDLEKMFKECKMIAVVQNNASNAEDMLILKNRLHKYDIRVRFFPNQVTRSFLKESVYSNMTPLFVGSTVMFVSSEPKVKEMLRILRASPQMTLLGACIENSLLSVNGVQNYSKLPSVTSVHGELVSGLTMMTSHTASMLQRHPVHLSALLQQYVKQQSDQQQEVKQQSTADAEEAA